MSLVAVFSRLDPLSTRSLNHLADLIRTHRHQRQSRRRRLDPGRPALLALAHLRNGDTLTRLAAGFQVNKAHARIRRHGERAVATLKTSRTTAMVQAILVLHRVENPTYQGGKTLSHADRPQ